MGIHEVIGLITIIFCIVWAFLERSRYLSVLSEKKSGEVRLGQIAEHLIPFIQKFKYNPKNAKFIGMPIDYIVFEEDRIIFLEVKTGGARLNKSQQRIKELVESGKVVFEEIRLEPQPGEPTGSKFWEASKQDSKVAS